MPARAAPKINPKIIEVTAIDFIVSAASHPIPKGSTHGKPHLLPRGNNGPMAGMRSEPREQANRTVTAAGATYANSSKPDQPTLIARTSEARSSTGIMGSPPLVLMGRLRR